MTSIRPTFRVFISSSFRDFEPERDVLRQKVFPALHKFCERHEARFQPIDLRWGISPEAGENQQTMNICLEELHRCQRITPRPNFIVMLGDRYGWRPLPAQIFEDEFQLLLESLPGDTVQANAELLQTWYLIDENAVPLERVLQPRTEPSEKAALRTVLQGAADAAFAKEDPRRWKYFDAATHQEIRHGALQAENAKEHVFCYFRNLRGLPKVPQLIDKRLQPYVDLQPESEYWDKDSHDRLKILKEELRTRFGKHVRGFDVTDPADTGWHDQLVVQMISDLRRIIRQRLAELAAEVEAPGDVEALVHKEFGRERSRHFTGRKDVLKRVDGYLSDASLRQPLVITGAAGSGKTALMAEVASRWSRGDSRIVSRFIGTTPSASDIRLLLRSLCWELDQHSGTADRGSDKTEAEKSDSTATHDYQELVRRFQVVLGSAAESKPIVVFLDALDQLDPTEGAEDLSWIPWTELPEYTKVVLSVITPGEPEANDDPIATSYRVATSCAAEVISLDAMTREEGGQLLDKWLARAGRRLEPWEYSEIEPDEFGVRRTARKLTSDQRNDILPKFEQHGLPLWLKLAYEESRYWKSYDDMPGLSGDISGILQELFERLEHDHNHGELFTRRALGFLAAGRRGLTEDELIDVLSTDKAVMDDFVARSPAEQHKTEERRLQRLPVLVWSRLYSDLEPYLAERAAFGTTVLNYYHRVVREAVRTRYCASNDRIHGHRVLAAYFGDHVQRPYFLESQEEQRSRERRLPPMPRLVNIRKVDELPYHLLEVAKLVGKDDDVAKEWEAVVDLLTDSQFLEAKAEAQP